MIETIHAITTKTAILINLLRWQVLLIALSGREKEKKVFIAKLVFGVTLLLLFASSFVFYYFSANNLKNSTNLVKFILGDVITSYLINAWVIFSYTLIFVILRSYFTNLLTKFADLISLDERA